MLDKNLIVSGGFKSGKTFGTIMPMVDDLIKSDKSLFIVDKNYEYYKTYYEKLKEKDYEIRILNFEEPKKSDGFNLLELPYSYYINDDEDKALEIVDGILRSLFVERENEDPFWNNSAISLVRGCIFKLFDLGKKEEINFLSIYRMLNALSEENIEVYKEFLLKKNTGIAYRDLVSILTMAKDTRLSILSVASLGINNVINYENRLGVISGDDFKLDEFFESEKKALFVVPKLEDEQVNVFVSMIINEVYDVSNNCYLVLDSLDYLPKISKLTGMVKSSTYKGIYMILAVRNLDKLTYMYGDSILEVCDVKTSEMKNITLPSQGDVYLPSLKKKNLETIDMLKLISEKY